MVLSIAASALMTATSLLTGIFGGDDARLTLDAAGGRIETGCSAGLLDGPVRLDARGRFEAAGRYDAYRPGPQAADGPPAAAEARFSGIVRGDDIELTIAASGAPPFVLHLERGRRTKLIRCL